MLKQRHIKWVFIVAFAIAALASTSGVICYYAGLRVCLDDSMPKGIYRQSGTPKEFVIVSIPGDWARLGIDRGYFRSNWRGDGALPAIKRHAAGEGDMVSIGHHGILVNGELVENSAPLEHDSRGREMPQHVILDDYQLKHGEFVVVSDGKANGFDSRYYGVLTKGDNFVSFAGLLWEW